MSRWSSSSSALLDESMRVEVDLKLRENELSLLQDIVREAQALAPVITEMGILTKLVLVGAGGLVCVWGGSAFCKAVVAPFGRKTGRKAGRRRKKGGESAEDGDGEEEGM
jgi:hypothetical protein